MRKADSFIVKLSTPARNSANNCVKGCNPPQSKRGRRNGCDTGTSFRFQIFAHGVECGDPSKLHLARFLADITHDGKNEAFKEKMVDRKFEASGLSVYTIVKIGEVSKA